jgi:hypothetical protein
MILPSLVIRFQRCNAERSHLRRHVSVADNQYVLPTPQRVGVDRPRLQIELAALCLQLHRRQLIAALRPSALKHHRLALELAQGRIDYVDVLRQYLRAGRDGRSLEIRSTFTGSR